MDLVSTETLEHLITIGRIFLIYNYYELIGLRIGGEIGCIFATLGAYIIEFDFPLDFSRCSNQIILGISLDLVQYLYYAVIVGCFRMILYGFYNLVHCKKKINVGIIPVLIALAIMGCVIKGTENSSRFAFFSKTDRVRDVLSVPKWIRNVEQSFCRFIPFIDRLKFSLDIRKWW